MRKHIHTHAEQLGMGTGCQARLHPEGLHRALHPARYTYLRLFDIRWYVLDVLLRAKNIACCTCVYLPNG